MSETEKIGILRDSGGALGEDLRCLAIEGRDRELRERLRNVANTASADQLGLTALMYAVWNGHVECVKLLIANRMGVDKDGNRCDSLLLQSNLGYTALHLAALDCPSWSVKEISFWLLLVYEDYGAVCGDGRTAIQIASDVGNEKFIEEYSKFTSDLLDVAHQDRVVHSRGVLASARYAFRMPAIPPRPKTKFSLPPAMQTASLKDERGADGEKHSKPLRLSSRLPPATLIPEHEIVPLVSFGNDAMSGATSLKCMKFALQQAEKNTQRRIGLINAFDSSMSALPVDNFVD